MRKLMYRVVFPLELKLTNTTADAEGADSLYGLAGVVVHVGSGPTHGRIRPCIRGLCRARGRKTHCPPVQG